MIGHEVQTVKSRLERRRSSDALLRLSDVSVSSHDPFGTHLDNINLHVNSGEIVGIAGVSGNGQQELSRVISGEFLDKRLPATAIRMLGTSVTHKSAAARRRLGFSFVPEERLGRGAVPSLSLAKNALLTAFDKSMLRYGFLRKNAIANFTQQCIDDFDVRCGGPTATASSLSGGNLQKFIVGRELSLAPELMFVAQPTWGVDIGAATAIRQKLLDLRDAGIAILIISEELDELFEISDRMYVLSGGRLSESLTTSELTPNEIGEYMIGNQATGNEASEQHSAN